MKYGGIVILAVCAGLFGLLKLFETELTYPLDPTPITPAEAGVAMDPVIMKAPDGEDIVLWYAPPQQEAAIVLYFPGNAGNLGNRAARFRLLTSTGLGVIAMAYRGSNGSGGAASEQALRRDARQVAELAAGRHPDTPISYYGESLGTGVAAWLATQIAPARMVLEAPYTSIPDAALQTQAPGWVRAVFSNLWDTQAHIAEVTVPLLVLHGIDDQVIPIEQGRTVFEAAGSADKRLMDLPGVGHHDVWQPEVQATLLRFLKG